MSQKRRTNFKILFSVVAAIALWLFVVLLENPSLTMWKRNVDVQIIGERTLTEQDLVIVKDSDLAVDVKLDGTRQGFFAKNEDGVKARIDVSDIDAPGTYQVEVKTVVSVQDASVVSISPAQLEITVEPLVTVEKEVEVKSSGKCEDGFKVHEIQAPTVLLSGPESVVGEITICADEISVSGASKDVVAEREVYMVNANGKKITREDCSIDSDTIEIVCDIAYEKTVPIAVDIQGEKVSGYRYDFSIDTAEVTIYGEKEKISRIQSIETAPINVSGVVKKKEVEAELILPDGVSVLPETKVTVTIEPTKEKE